MSYTAKAYDPLAPDGRKWLGSHKTGAKARKAKATTRLRSQDARASPTVSVFTTEA